MTAAEPRLARREAWIAGLAVAVVASAAQALTHPGELLHGLSDDALLVPLARRAWTTSYVGDHWLELAAAVFSRAWSELLGLVLFVFDDPVVASRAISVPLQIVFFTATWFLVRTRSGRAEAWGAVAALAIAPPLLSALVGPDVGGPLAAGSALPRDVVFAVLPIWWMVCADDRIDAARWTRVAAFAGLGMMSVIHPLTAVHAVILFAAVRWALEPSWARVREAAICSVAGAVTTAQYLVQWAGFPRTPGSVPREELLARIGGIGADAPSFWVARMEVPILLGAAALVLGRGRSGPGWRTLRVSMLVAGGLAALSPAFNAVVAGMQIDRLTRFATWAAIVLIAVELPAAGRARDRRTLGVAAACVALALGGHPLLRSTLGVDRSPLELAARRIGQRLGVEPSAADAGKSRERPGDPSADPQRAAAFREVCAWCRREAPADALFAVPPEDWGAFRAYACRGVVVTRKEGGFAMTFLGGRGNDWVADYRDAVETYASGEADRWAAWASRREFGWAVLDRPGPVPPGWTERFAAGPYRVVAR